MKYIKIIAVFCAILALLPHGSHAQDDRMIEVKAIVVGSDNEPIAGAIVTNRSDDAVVVTDASGTFTLQAIQNSTLLVRAIGYKEKTVSASVDLVQVMLQPDIEEVQLFFRRTNKRDIVGAVSVVNVREEFEKNFTTHPTDGLITLAGGWNGNSIWGRGSVLVVVDGIPREANTVSTTEIDHITVLKGAGAVALYGPRAINGVIYITTKRGSVSEQRIDVRVNTGMHVPIRFPEYLGAAEYMTLYSEAQMNDGILTRRHSQEFIDNTAAGLNPYRYPDIDFYSSEFLRNTVNRTDVNAEIYGGNERARYYSNIGFWRQGSLLDFGQGSKNNENRFNLRGNVDVKINEWLTANVDAGALFFSGLGVQTNYWQQAANVRPTMGSTPFHPLIPISMIDMSNAANAALVQNSDNIIDGRYILGGNLENLTNPFAAIHAAGFNKFISRQFLFNTGLDMDLSGITEGLAFRTKIGIDYNTSYDQGYNHQYRIHQPTWSTVDGIDIITGLTVFDASIDRRNPDQYIGNSSFRQLLYMSGQLDYKRSLNDRHNLLAMVIANGYQFANSGVYHKTSSTNLATHFGYNYLNRYYLEFNGSLMHSTKLPENNRASFSPVVSLGWRIGDENFMDWAAVIDDLKFTATAGMIYSDLDIPEHYMYAARYSYRGVGWFAWAAGMGRDVTASLRGANPDFQAPRREELSVGIEAALFDKLLEIEGNYFSVMYSDGIVEATTLFPSYMMTGWPQTSFIPFINYNAQKRFGYDFNVRVNKQVGNVALRLGVAGTYYDTEIVKLAERHDYDYRYRTGTPVDGIWGWKTDGFYADQADINNSARPTFGTILRPGDIKYVDQNNDGVIDSDDEVFLARGGWFGAPFTMGVNLTARWKGLTFYAQGVGSWGGHGMRNRLTDWVFGERKYSDVVRGRWAYYTHPVTGEVVDTRATATYPRLTTQSGDHNFRNSDFWLFSTDRIDISKVQVTYRLPESIVRNSFVRNVDIYVSGANLLTLSPEKKYLETTVGGPPQTRFYSLGVSASF